MIVSHWTKYEFRNNIKQSLIWGAINALNPEYYGRQLTEDNSKCILLNKTFHIFSMTFLPVRLINNGQMMARRLVANHCLIQC